MLQMGLSHGVAVIPNPPKQRYTCPLTGAHFKFDEMCTRIEALMRERKLKWKNECDDFARTNPQMRIDESKTSNHSKLIPGQSQSKERGHRLRSAMESSTHSNNLPTRKRIVTGILNAQDNSSQSNLKTNELLGARASSMDQCAHTEDKI